jgi:phosphohistidine phosphatase
MEIYLLRHGIAEDQQAGSRDADRALTAEGKKRLREVLQTAKNAGVQPELIVTSPFRRARETAQIAAEALGTKEPLIASESLTPMGDARDVWNEIRVHKDVPSLLLASHEPLTGLLAAYLLNSPNLAIDVKKGAIIRIDVDSFGAQPRGVLRWMLTPRLAAK